MKGNITGLIIFIDIKLKGCWVKKMNKRGNVILTCLVIIAIAIAVLIGGALIPGVEETATFETFGYGALYVCFGCTIVACIAWLYPYAFYLFCDIAEEHAKNEKKRQVWDKRADYWYEKIVTEQL